MKSIYYYMLAGLTLSTSGCSSWLSEDDAPVMSYDYYETEAGVNAAITAAYGFLRWGVGGERFNVLTELGTDLFTEGEDGSNRESYNKYATQLNPDDGILYEMWENHYKGISDANIAMQKILDSQDLLESVKTQSYAEMQFIRAYLYFDLVQQFGRIPLVTEGSFEIRTDFKRAPVADIYNVIISDLRNAAENLPEKASVLGRATRYSAAHLLAKVYLTRGSAVKDARGQKATDMDSTLYYAEQVINSGAYSLQETSPLCGISRIRGIPRPCLPCSLRQSLCSMEMVTNSIFIGCLGMKTSPVCYVTLKWSSVPPSCGYQEDYG